VTPPDVPARIGVPLLRFGPDHFCEVSGFSPESDSGGEHYLAFPVTPEAVTEMQQSLARRIGFDLECDVVDGDECAWNLMAILGFDGGAS
jgi:hypothetical protein